MAYAGVSWMDEALCGSCNTDAFFPSPGRKPTKEMKKFCAVCPVHDECEEHANKLDIRDGLWNAKPRRRGPRKKAS